MVRTRYNHWFWNSWLMDKLAHGVSRLHSYLWQKQYGGYRGK